MTESNATDFDITDKIAKLLKKAESATPAEAEMLSAKAEQLMMKYAITQATLNAKRMANGHQGEQIISVRIPNKGVYAGAYSSLAGQICKALTTVQAYNEIHHKDGFQGEIVLVGYESDVRQVEALFLSLKLQCAVAMSAWWKGLVFPPTGSSRVCREKRTFIIGFGYGAGRRINLSRTTAEVETGPGTALVLVDRGDKVKTWLNNNVAGLVQGKSISTGSFDARDNGTKAGLNSNTGDKAVRTGARELA